jgi:hypothetical protein
MVATFDFFLGVDPEGVDPDLGYPDDGHRLVQAWAWYSLDDDTYRADGTVLSEGYNGDLYRGGNNKWLTLLGQDYGNYIQQNGLVTEYVDLYPEQLSLDGQDPVYGQPITLSITTQVANYGNVTTTMPVEVQLWDGDPQLGGISLGVISTTSTVPPRYQGDATASMSWQTVATGTRSIHARVDPGQTVAEPREDNNSGALGFSFYTDWAVSDLGVSAPVPIFTGGVLTLTLAAQVENGGNTAGKDLQVVFSEQGGPTIGTAMLEAIQSPGSSSYVEVTWPVDRAGLYQIRVMADPADAFLEPNESDNERLASILVPSQEAYLPLVLNMAGTGG